MPDQSKLITVPAGKLGIIAMKSSEKLGEKVDDYLVKWRNEREHLSTEHIMFNGYSRDTFLIKSCCPRFASGEAKGTISDSVRGSDLYILADVTNTSIEYNLGGRNVPMTPDEHYADIKRVIAASAGKAHRINVIMPFLYESRQHKRTSRESLDCALALQELVSMGVSNIITFDAHDPRVQNAIPTILCKPFWRRCRYVLQEKRLFQGCKRQESYRGSRIPGRFRGRQGCDHNR